MQKMLVLAALAPLIDELAQMAKIQLTKFAPNCSIRIHHLRNRAPIFDWHAHDCFELLMLIGGSGNRYIGNDVSESSNDELILIPPFTPHTWDSTYNAKHVVIILFSQELLNINVPEMHSLKCWLNDMHHSTSLTLENNIHHNCYIEPLIKIKSNSPFERVTTLLAVLNSFLNDTQHHKETFMYHHQKNVTKLINLLEDKNEKSLPSCAKSLNMSESTLKRLIKNELNTTFTDMYRQVRLKKAQKLLACTQMSINIIAEQSGFNSIRAFNDAFKLSLKMTPLQFRKKYKWRRFNPVVFS